MIDTTKFLVIKIKKAQYYKEDILAILNYLDDDTLHPQEISNKIDNRLSARQIKKIRYIKNADNEEAINILLECKWYISSIESFLKEEKHNKKKALKKLGSEDKNIKKDKKKNGFRKKTV